MPKLHDKIYYAVIWRQNWLAMKWIDRNKITIEQGLYRGAIQLMHHAIRYRNYSMARKLLKRGVDINAVDAMDATALQDATQRGHFSGMQWLIRHGANFEGQKDELLLAAVRCGHEKILKWLIDQGCDVNAMREDGQNPLRHCYEYGMHKSNERIAEILREHGAEFPPGYEPED